MTKHSVRAVRAVELGVGDPARAARFFTEVWRLTPVEATSGDTVDLRLDLTDATIVPPAPTMAPKPAQSESLTA